MPTDHPSTSAERLRRRAARIAILFLVFMGLALGVGAWQLARSQSQDRAGLRSRFASRATVTAGVLDSLFGVAFRQSAAQTTRPFKGPVCTASLVAYAKQTQVVYVAVITAQGRTIAASPGAPAAPGHDILAAAVKSGFALGDISRSGQTRVVESAILFPGADGPRLLVSGSPGQLFTAFLSGSLKPLTPSDQGAAYVLDGRGGVLGSVGPGRGSVSPPVPALVRAVAAGHTSGFYTSGHSSYFASAAQPHTHWHVVVTEPTSVLYKTASGVGRWLPWVILGFLALALVSIGLLMRRAIEAGARIADVNAQLETSQDRLRDRAFELQSANAELQRSNSDLEQFAYVASHDLSAPLRAVAGFSQLLGVRYRGRLDSDADEFIRHMQDGVDRMQRIIDDLLAYSRVDRSGLQAERIDLDAILEEVLHSLGPDIAERDAEVTSDPLGMACGEPGQLSQVLQNLVANGIKFTAPGVRPAVHVSTERADGRVRVHVRDNGIGVDPDHIEQIFKMFQRLHASQDYPGTGIGLAIANKIVDRHGGEITLTPADGGGTVFTFDIPAEMSA
jgi:signal transduction histidine kinase